MHQPCQSVQRTESLPVMGGRNKTCETIRECTTILSLSGGIYPDASTTLADTFAGHVVTEYSVYESPPKITLEQYSKEFNIIQLFSFINRRWHIEKPHH